jgi:two-component system sensor histidine kinase UhpB
MERSPSTIQLIIKDNGRGISQSKKNRGFGLLGMRERVASLQGQFKLINRPGQGLEIRIDLPLKN